MNTNSSANTSIFTAASFASTTRHEVAASTLRAACREVSDTADAVLRGVLVLCMVVGLTVCGQHISARSAHAAANVAAQSAPAPQAAVAARTCPTDARYAF